ncbi:DUF1800 family protein [Brevundimonas sp.]|uniref:DUF1800 domain-containing protein n=1 Tax=Brevundimonas sp. TaxID=1871086 RepID=UPI00356B2EE6
MPPSAAEAAAVAVTRFGLGARPGEIERVAADPRGWLEAQVTPGGAPNPAGRFVASAERMQQLLAYRAEAAATPATDAAMTPGSAMAQESAMGDPAAEAALAARRDSRRDMTLDTAREFLARAQMGATTEAGFAERWALFWANAFTTSATKFQSAVFMGPYEREAIRPHVFGKFEDLAVAAEQHPAMLLYLDQAQSVGPNSQAGQRRNAGLNENLAREILELHTVGADGGYSQADVTEFARALTGWSTPTPRDQAPGDPGMAGGNPAGQGRRARAIRAAMAGEPGENAFVFRPVVHEPGARTVLGRTYAPGGREQGEAVLRDLARRPETARRLARKLAVHFTVDDPPPALIDTLEAAWTRSDGDLAAVARTLIAAPEAWSPRPVKMKTPYDFIISTHRALGSSPARVQPLQQALISMGQPAFSAPSPEGWPDTAADWAGPDALVKRLDWARAVADLAAPAADPNAVAAGALGARLGERTRQFVARAESRPEALTLFLMSPEFQRR